MHSLIRTLLDHVPPQFRVLYRQFLLRIIDLEALSIQADIPRFLGQFAGVLIMFSLIRALGFLASANNPRITRMGFVTLTMHTEQRLISTMMLIAGLVAVMSWDATFPDRRDIIVISPLPVRTTTILFAKVAAASAVLSLAILALNFASGVALPLVLGGIHTLFNPSRHIGSR